MCNERVVHSSPDDTNMSFEIDRNIIKWVSFLFAPESSCLNIMYKYG